jgi:hypothetical protein
MKTGLHGAPEAGINELMARMKKITATPLSSSPNLVYLPLSPVPLSATRIVTSAVRDFPASSTARAARV